MDQMCHDGVCARCWGVKYVVVGAAILVTAVKWPDYVWHVLGALLVLKGVLKLAMPQGCSHCQEMPAKKKK